MSNEPMRLPLDLNGLTPERAVASLLAHAADLQVSDVFLCTDEKSVRVMVRHLGLLRLVCHLPPDLGRRCLAHVKAMSMMDVQEKRRPLDGRWIVEREGRSALDLRIATVPTMYGEDFTIRLLDRESRWLHLDQLGLLRRDLNQLAAVLSSPSGLILVTGPTGAGKTTTLYACLRHLNNGERKINTIEDPIEYAVDGLRQSQVNPRLDVGFPELLRSVLRQAPDVIMVGEIRDPITAVTAVRAANSGHLVLATMHAPAATGAVPALLNLGVHPHYLASSLLGAIAQRLVRTLCSECKISYELGEGAPTFDEVRRFLEPGQGQQLYGPKGCPACRMEGFAGRTGVFEMLTVTPALRKMILERPTQQDLRRQAAHEGLIEFRQAALLKVAQGVTSVEEVFRSVPTEFLGREE